MKHLPALAVGLAVVAAALLRLWTLDNRPIHHDEAVNWFFISGVAHTGIYDYDASNYHGPLHFHVGGLFRALFGGSLAVERLPTALVGLAMPALVWPLRRWLGDWGTVAAAWLFATSPALVFFARDAIHETWLSAASLGVLAALAVSDRYPRAASAAAGVCLGAMIATKETVIITVCSWIVGVACWTLARRSLPPRPDLPWRPAAWGCGIVVLLTYTSFFRQPSDLVDLAMTLGLWGPRGIDGDGHGKPPTYWVELMWMWEQPILVLSLLGTAWAAYKREPAQLIAAGWAWSTFAVYSIISYKTPWLVLQILTPLVLLAGVAVQALSQRAWWAAALVVAGSSGLLATQAHELSFERYDDPSTKLVYVQTHRELDEAMGLVRSLERPDGDKLFIRSFFHARYPMNWYLRGAGLHEEDTPWPEEADGDVLLVTPKDEAALREHLRSPYYRKVVRFRGWMKMAIYVRPSHKAALDDSWRRVVGMPDTFDPGDPPESGSPGLRQRVFKGRIPIGDPESTGPGWPNMRFDREADKPVRSPLYVVWDGWVEVPQTGRWTFALRSDDGSKLWLDGQPLVDNWGEHAAKQAAADRVLQAGPHHLRVDWFDAGGAASIELSWKRGAEEALSTVPSDRMRH